MPDRDAIHQAATAALLDADGSAMGGLRDIQVADGKVTLEVAIASLGQSNRETIRARLADALRRVEGVEQADVVFSSGLASSPGGGPQQRDSGGVGPGPEPSDEQGDPLPDVKHVVAVGAGKGGVGKSTIAVNLAVGLARAGHKVGILDGDIYGPSLPTMLGTDRYQPRAEGQTLLPFNVHGVSCISLGDLVEDDRPLIWRGPVAHGAFRQLITQTAWGPLDYLIIDLPPGTGDVPLTMSQTLPLTGAVIVCTPQKVAQDDARRAVGMFRTLEVEVLGVVENMSYFIGDDGKQYDLFGRGGAELMAQKMGLPFLGAVPINMNLRRHCDGGDPTANFTADATLAEALTTVATRLDEQVQTVSLEQLAEQPTMTVR
jgi:ATP-binding protein involved in chromosome partitioning